MNFIQARWATITTGALLGVLAMGSPAHAATPFQPGTLTLRAGEFVTAEGVTLALTSSGDVQVRDATGRILWRSGTSATCSISTCVVKFQGDQNLVLTLPSGAVPLSRTSGLGAAARLFLSPTPPYLSVGIPGSPLRWTTQSSYLKGGFSLAGDQTVTVNGVYLSLSATGDVKIRRVPNDQLLWSSGPSPECASSSPCALSFAATGALQLTNANGQVWTTGTVYTVPVNNVQVPAADSLVLSGYAPYLSILRSDGAKHPAMWATGPAANTVTYVAPYLTLGASEKIAFGGARLVFDAGKLKVLTAQNNGLLWQSGAPSCGTACAVRFLNGDLSIKNNGSEVWNSGTGGHNESALTLSPTEPHLSIQGSHFDPLWSSATGKVTTPPVRTVSAPVRGIPVTGTTSTYKADTVQSFLDSLGINTHQDQYESNVAVAWNRLQELGLLNVRDHAPGPATSQRNPIDWFAFLAQQGVRFTLLNYSTDVPTILQQAKAVAALPRPVGKPSPLHAIEGLNEINNFKFFFDGFQCEAGLSNACGGAAAKSQAMLMQAVIADPALSTTYVYDLTGGLSAVQAPALGLTTIDNRADRGSVHVYPGATQPYETMKSIMGTEYKGLYATNGVVTEGGYATEVVGELAQAIMGINLWLDGYRLGFHRTYLYKLSDNAGQTKDFWGFYTAAGTRKTIANVTINLTSILRDEGAALSNTGYFNWSTAAPFTGHSLLLQKSDQSFYLILWREPQVVQVVNKQWQNIDPGLEPVQLNIEPSTSVRIFDPFVHTQPVSTLPVGTPITRVDLQLGSHPLIVEITRP